MKFISRAFSSSSSIIKKMIARKFILAKQFEGLPKLTDFKLVEEKLQEIQDGEILVKAEWLTVDPYMRSLHVVNVKVGDQLKGGQVGRVIESKSAEFPVGSQVFGFFGWRDLTVYKPEPNGPRIHTTIYKLPDMKGLPPSYALGCMGMPGNTAYFGFGEICQPKKGEVVVVSAAAGAVGSLVGQIAKIKGCKVIGFAGDDDKLDWLKKDLGFDEVFNYKKVNLDETFKKYVPEGIDCYFDNVGGEFVYHVIANMNEYGRISQCGSISTYNDILKPGELVMEPFDYKTFRFKSIKLEGFNVVRRWTNRWAEGINQIQNWILEGKIKPKETITEGFENMPSAFIQLFQGKNFGKQIIKA